MYETTTSTADLPGSNPRSELNSRSSYGSSKRALDAFLIMLALPCLIVLGAVVALLIRSVSKGAILFKQDRIGHLGRRFTCFKFRTMHAAGDTAAHEKHLNHLIDSNTPMTKLESRDDPRIIPFGLILRTTGLDELPQLLNVLRGEMSLVGPRPCLPYEYDKYLPWQKERFLTVPGLTGLWQVSGKNRTTFVEMIQLDIRYAKTKSFLGDCKIILMTVPALISQMIETRQARKLSCSGAPSASTDSARSQRREKRLQDQSRRLATELQEVETLPAGQPESGRSEAAEAGNLASPSWRSNRTCG